MTSPESLATLSFLCIAATYILQGFKSTFKSVQTGDTTIGKGNISCRGELGVTVSLNEYQPSNLLPFNE